MFRAEASSFSPFTENSILETKESDARAETGDAERVKEMQYHMVRSLGCYDGRVGYRGCPRDCAILLTSDAENPTVYTCRMTG